MNFPNPKTLTGRALARLFTGKHISHRDFQNDVASYRLSHDIYVLRGLGWPVQDTWHNDKTKDPTGRRASYKRYFLPEKLLSEIGDKTREYIEKVKVFETRTMGTATPKAHVNHNINDRGIL